jgi:hypothetical protein
MASRAKPGIGVLQKRGLVLQILKDHDFFSGPAQSVSLIAPATMQPAARNIYREGLVDVKDVNEITDERCQRRNAA